MINSIGGQARVTAPTIFKFQINGENAGETTNKISQGENYMVRNIIVGL